MNDARLWATVALLAVAACDCPGDPLEPCSTSADCPAASVCRDGTCVPGSRMDAGRGIDAGDGEGCASMTLCGTPPACCDLGQDCIEDRCVAACASGVRCGEDLSTCCATGQVCLSRTCVDPGDPCTDSFECEMGSFCEPTLGRCLPQMEPVACETEPSFGPFEPTLEWSVTSAEGATADCVHAITTPAIVDLDGDRVPEVVLNMSCADDWERAVVRAYHGNDGSHVWSVTDPALQVNGRATVAAGDLTGDGRPEIVALGRPTDSRLYAFNPDGTLLWQSHDAMGAPLVIAGYRNGAPTIADLDMDGTPEVILGALVLDATGALLWTRGLGAEEGSNAGYAGGISAVADVDLDGMPEVVAGRNAYEHDGTPKWTATGEDGYPAIAQFDMDPQPEVVLVASGTVRIHDGMTGALEWGPVALPGGGRGGPPTVADFDGDGEPEIGVAGAASYSVYDPTGLRDVLWSMATQDMSSNTTGSSVFDFEGDGAAEVVYADECYVRVYRGSDGMVLLQVPSSSATIHEYPVVADVDADGNSEIVIVANSRGGLLCTEPGYMNRAGLFVYGDARDRWVRTRRVWNQHAYHVTNIGTDGVVPTVETNNWTTPGLNNYRQNVQGEGVFNAPNLTVIALEVRLDGCPTGATLRARVANEGSLGVAAGVPVSFYEGTPAMRGMLLGTAMTTVPLLPGESTIVELAVSLSGTPPYAFVAVVDDDGTGAGIVNECIEDDNAAAIADVDCDVIF